MKKVFITVRGGCAYVMEDTLPPCYVVEVIDFDNIDAGDLSAQNAINAFS